MRECNAQNTRLPNANPNLSPPSLTDPSPELITIQYNIHV